MHARPGQLTSVMLKDLTEVLQKARKHSIYTFLKLAQLRWTDHVTKLLDEGLSKKIFYGELQVEKRLKGGQEKGKDTLKHPSMILTYHRSLWQ